jgi:hypothetical protein
MIMVTLTKKPKWVCLAVYIRDGISKGNTKPGYGQRDTDGVWSVSLNISIRFTFLF